MGTAHRMARAGDGESHLNARRTFVVVISELDVQPYHRPLCLPHAG